ncbi:MAG: hypothetical protein RSB76_02895 [Clostridia bacterium]
MDKKCGKMRPLVLIVIAIILIILACFIIAILNKKNPINLKGKMLNSKINEIPIPIGGSIYQDRKGKKVPIPKGFVVSADPKENIVDLGLVIKQGDDALSTTSNEFVWIPVSNIKNKFGVLGKNIRIEKHLKNSNISTNIDIKKSVEKYFGFYIGRYETGLSKTAKYSDNDTILKNATVFAKKDSRECSSLSYKKEVQIPKDVYSDSYVDTLTTPYKWDSTLNYLQIIGAKMQAELINDSTNFRDYLNLEFNIKNSTDFFSANVDKEKLSNTRMLLARGAKISNMTANIYDMINSSVSTSNVLPTRALYCDGKVCVKTVKDCPRFDKINNAALFCIGIYII